MAALVVEVCRIDRVLAHPNADRLELAQIKGWQCVVPRGRYQAGSLVTYIPVDAVLPAPLAERLGIAKYLTNGRVRCARLRGEPSYGVLVDVEDPSWTEGTDVRAHYGIEKYVPPLRVSAGDAETPHPLFASYTDIENLRNFTGIFEPGEEVSVTEKIHGTNCRVGLVEGEWMAGSMEVRRKRPPPEETARSTYWFPTTLDPVRALVQELAAGRHQAILYGEVYGAKIQSLSYGKANELGFAAFDALADGRFLDVDELAALCARHGVPKVPEVFRGPFSLEAIRAASGGRTTFAADHIREGVVVRPVHERTHPAIGRVILKYLGDDYLLAKGISDTNDV